MNRVLAASMAVLLGTSAYAGVLTRDQQRENIRRQGEAFCNHYPDDIACKAHGEALSQPTPQPLPPPPPPSLPPVVIQQPPVIIPQPPVIVPQPPIVVPQVCGVNVYCPPPIITPAPPPICMVSGPWWVWQNLRTVPNGPIIAPLPPGTPVRLLGVSGRWGNVQAPLGSIGWMFLPYMTCS